MNISKLLGKKESTMAFLGGLALVALMGVGNIQNDALLLVLALLGAVVGMTNVSGAERGSLILVSLFLATIGIGGFSKFAAAASIWGMISIPLLTFASAMGFVATIKLFYEIGKN